jgi:GntR family transcriptional regulator, transcriptional repressor for pyruvate dehydrogenase complex
MHRELYRAIRARKPQEAHNLMEQHLRMAQIAQGMERPTGRKGSPRICRLAALCHADPSG